jgi:hypothetical protein
LCDDVELELRAHAADEEDGSCSGGFRQSWAPVRGGALVALLRGGGPALIVMNRQPTLGAQLAHRHSIEPYRQAAKGLLECPQAIVANDTDEVDPRL